VGDLYMQSPFTLDASAYVPAEATRGWQGLVALLGAQGIDLSMLPAPGPGDIATLLARFNDSTFGFDPIAAESVRDIPAAKAIVENTFEIGYRGTLDEGRLRPSVDFHFTRIEGGQTGLMATPSVLLDPVSTQAYLAQFLGEYFAAQVAPTLSMVPVGTVTPIETGSENPAELFFIEANVSRDVSLYGIDLAIDYRLDPRWRFKAAYSYLSEDLFEDEDLYVNAPQHKFSGEASYRHRSGFTTTGSFRYVHDFPFFSAGNRSLGARSPDPPILMRLPGVIAGCLLLSLISAPADCGTVVLSSGSGHYPLGPHAEILEDKHGEWTIEDVTGPDFVDRFEPVGADVIARVYTDSAFWIRFAIQDLREESDADRWIFEIGAVDVSHIALYEPDESAPGGWLVKETGSLLPFASREIDHHNFLFRLTPSGRTPRTIVLRAESRSELYIPLSLWSPSALLQQTNQQLLAVGLCLGALLILAAYNLFLFSSLRDPTYLFYVLFLTAAGLILGTAHGLCYQYLWSESPQWNMYAPPRWGGWRLRLF
jgi:hypothetical protein